jgi:hypothetical protein
LQNEIDDCSANSVLDVTAAISLFELRNEAKRRVPKA